MKRLLLAYKILVLLSPLAILIILFHIYLPRLAREEQRRSLGKGYRLFQSRHFVIYTAGSPRYAELLTRTLDAYKEAFFRRYRDSFRLAEIEGTIQVFLFKNHEDFQNYGLKDLRQDLSNNAGFYNPANKTIAIISNMDPHEDIRSILHEGTHMIFDLSAGKYDSQWTPWFSEGTACYFEQSRFGQGAIHFGGLHPAHLAIARRAIETGTYVSLRDLLRAPPSAFTSEGNAIYYSESALLTYYLLHGEGGKYRDRFFRYFLVERKPGRASPDDFEEAFQVDLEELERNWIAFVRNPHGRKPGR
jgi:hypothetical protein